MEHDDWCRVFNDAGFDLVAYQTDAAFMTCIYLLRARRIDGAELDHCFIDVNDIEDFSWIEPLQTAVEERMQKPDTHTIWLIDTEVSRRVR